MMYKLIYIYALLSVLKRVAHPSFDPTTLQYDLVMLKTDPMTFGVATYIRVTRLPYKYAWARRYQG